jgi:hypothetical protein
MMSRRARRSVLAALAIIAALALGAPVASAEAVPGGLLPGGVGSSAGGGAVSGPCAESTAGQGQGRVGAATQLSCTAGGLVFNGPQIGQISSVIGPTIISPGFVGTVVVTSGDAAVGVP